MSKNTRYKYRELAIEIFLVATRRTDRLHVNKKEDTFRQENSSYINRVARVETTKEYNIEGGIKL